jgi:hypothetical protein
MEITEKKIRFFGAELRAAETEDMSVEGYALKFDKAAFIGGKQWGWNEQISRTALDGAKLDDVVFNYNHSLDSILARTINNSLQLTVDGVGLRVTAKVIDTAAGRDVFKMIKEGLINRMSFAAEIRKSLWTLTEDGSDTPDSRVITEFGRFYDVSAVPFPAYDDTAITARNEEYAFRQRQLYEIQIQKLEKIIGGIKK